MALPRRWEEPSTASSADMPGSRAITVTDQQTYIKSSSAPLTVGNARTIADLVRLLGYCVDFRYRSLDDPYCFGSIVKIVIRTVEGGHLGLLR